MRRTIVSVITALSLIVGGVVAYAAEWFTDVPADHAQVEDIQYAVDQGWFKGYEDGTFRPDNRLTTYQVVTVFERAFPEGPTRADLATILKAGKEQLDDIPIIESEGNWTYDSNNERTIARVTSPGKYDFYDPHVLGVRCKWSPSEGDTLDVYWSFSDAWARGSITVEYSFPAAKIGAVEEWIESISRESTFSPNAVEFARFLIDNHDNGRLFIKSNPEHGHSASTTFDVTGANVAVQKVLEACGY